MFDRYTEQARRVIFFARYEASERKSAYIDTEHLLAGLLREVPDRMAMLLGSPEAIEEIRDEIDKEPPAMPADPAMPTSVDMQLSLGARRALVYAAEQSERLHDSEIRPDHLLMGLLRVEDSFSAQLFIRRGLTLAAITERVEREPAPKAPTSMSGALTLGGVVKRLHGDSQALTNMKRWFQQLAGNDSELAQDLERYSSPAQFALVFARQEASAAPSGEIDLNHLVLGVFDAASGSAKYPAGEAPGLPRDSCPVPAPASVLEAWTLFALRREIREAAGAGSSERNRGLALSDPVRKAIREAVEIIHIENTTSVDLRHLLLAVLKQQDSFAAGALRRRGITPEMLRAFSR